MNYSAGDKTRYIHDYYKTLDDSLKTFLARLQH